MWSLLVHFNIWGVDMAPFPLPEAHLSCFRGLVGYRLNMHGLVWSGPQEHQPMTE